MRRLGFALLLVAAACTEEATSPGVCPNFCPGGSIQVRDTIFTTIIERDSAFRGYVQGYRSVTMAAADLPGVQSRPFFVLNPMITSVKPKAGDTITTVPISVDSSRLRISIVQRAKEATNLQLRLYRLPLTADSTSDFAALDPFFNGPVVDSVNVSALLASPAIGDTATLRVWGDTIRTDSAGHVLQIARSDSAILLYFALDTLKAPFSVPDSGRLAFGVRVAADSFASLSLGATESGSNSPVIRWFYHYTIPDTVSATPDSVVHTNLPRAPRFDSFVFDPPTPPLDSNLVVGGVPSARSLLRVAMPAFLHDSFDVVRATMILVPVAAFSGAPSDSMIILARPVQTDLGAKSPIDSTVARVVVPPGSTDTVRIELTDLVRAWAFDTTRATALFLGQAPEAGSWKEIRFYSSRTPALRPGLQVTYVKRFPFGEP